MTDRALYLCTAAVLDAAGMIAENQYRAMRGYSQAYGDTAFFKLAQDLRLELAGQRPGVNLGTPIGDSLSAEAQGGRP